MYSFLPVVSPMVLITTMLVITIPWTLWTLEILLFVTAKGYLAVSTAPSVKVLSVKGLFKLDSIFSFSFDSSACNLYISSDTL